MSGDKPPEITGERSRDVVPELPSPDAMAAAASGTAFHDNYHHQHHIDHNSSDIVHAPESSTSHGTRLPHHHRRRDSSASRVAIDHFDPEGVQELKRTLTQQSATARSIYRTLTAQREQQHPKSSSGSSVSTAVDDSDASEKFDLEKILREMVKRQEEDQSIKPRELGVVFQNLRVQGLGRAASYQATLGSTINPFNIPAKVREALHPSVRDIISGFEGVVFPGEMLLVLGRPGAGCTTLLKTLSNQHEEYHSVSGLLHYSSFTPKQVHKHFRGDVIYCPEDDVHFPTLTVQETLSFAARTRMPNKNVRLDGMSEDDYVETVTKTLGTVFGLRHVKDTKVGDAAIRGVSGGERKRVSIAEALATRAKLGAWDNSTRGLDSSTAVEFVRALRIATEILGLTSIVSIYQASEILYKLFDKVCVIYEGKMIYYGQASEARQYFIEMGYEPANRQTTSDFLVAVTDPHGRTPRAGFENRVPRSADEMDAYFQKHPLAAVNREEIATFLAENVIIDDGDDRVANLPDIPHISDAEKEEKRKLYIQSARAEHGKHTHLSSPYTLSMPMQVKEVIVRRVQILRGDWSTQLAYLLSYVFQGIIIGTLFLKAPEATSAYFSRGGVLFFSLLFGALSAMSEIPSLFSQRPIVHRHHKSAMYYPFAESLALTIVDIPITFVIMVVFSVILYFLVKLQQSAGQFFIFFLFVFTMTITMRAYFRAVAAMFKQEAGALSIAGLSTFALVLYTGYMIPKPSMIGALRWITYINPLRYGFESILTNEFHTLNGTCSSLVPQGAGYENVSLANQVCTTVGSVPGQAFVDGNTFVQLSYAYSYSHLWRNFGILIAFTVLFIFLLNFFTQINTASAGESSVTLFKRGTNAPIENSSTSDEEKSGPHTSDPVPEESTEDVENAMKGAPEMTDIFSWQHLNYIVPVGHGETRQLLNDVSGYVAPGKLTALMGESGAGKTTLLNVLAERTDVGVITGDRFVNGHTLPRDFQAQTGYCQQMDTHLPETTVREALLFSAKLRQPQEVPLAEKEAYVETCLKMCGLENHADAIVGTLSVEHKKRTTIGVELAAKPRLLLFLDEPTSGLDSQSAWAIVSFLKELANHGQAILCTIHQPSGELFQSFDRLLLLRKGGQTVYFGDLGKNSTTMINYFERNGARHCDPEENPAEWMLDVIGAGATASSSIDWHNVWNNCKEFTQTQSEIEDIHNEGRKKPPVQATRKSEFASSWVYQAVTLTQRAFLSYWRDPTYLIAKLILNIFAGLFIGFTFFKSKDTMQGTQNKLFAIFMSTILTVPLSNQLQVIFIKFRNIYEVRERPSRMYSWTALVTSQLIVELPWNIFGASLFFLCWYWTVGFETSRAGYTYLMYCVVLPLYYTSIAQAIAAMSPNAPIASILFSTLFPFVISFNGVLQPYRQLNWWRWMYRVSPYTYLIEGLLGQAVGHLDINCSSKELAKLTPPSGLTCGEYMQNYIAASGGYLTNPNDTSDCMFCSSRTTDQFLGSSFNIFYSHHWRNFGLLLAYICFNVAWLFAATYLFRIRKGNIFAPIINFISSRRRRVSK